MSTANIRPVPTLTIGDDSAAIVDLLRELQESILVHPEAARAILAALTNEGRLYAQTPEGARMKEQLRHSELVHRALLVWQTSTLWMTEEGESGAAPSALIDAIASAAASPHRDKLLDQLFRQLDGG